MGETFLYMLVCIGAINCPKEPIYSSEPMASESSCRDKAPKVAMYMHYSQGGDWAWKCFKADYKPRELQQ